MRSACRHRKNNKLNEMSGGEQQRTAIAIALANQPRLLLADEPTGSVDRKTSDLILDLFRELNRRLNLTIVIVTHDPALAKNADRAIAIRDGRTSSEMIRKKSYLDDLAELEASASDEASHEEFVVVDRVGRIQLPETAMSELEADSQRIKVIVEDGQVVLKSK